MLAVISHTARATWYDESVEPRSRDSGVPIVPLGYPGRGSAAGQRLAVVVDLACHAGEISRRSRRWRSEANKGEPAAGLRSAAAPVNFLSCSQVVGYGYFRWMCHRGRIWRESSSSMTPTRT